MSKHWQIEDVNQGPAEFLNAAQRHSAQYMTVARCNVKGFKPVRRSSLQPIRESVIFSPLEGGEPLMAV